VSADDGALALRQMLARSRLSLDACEPGRTAFLSHLGAAVPLTPAPWIAHRDLLHALALANLTPAQRSALVRAVLVGHGSEFGVGRLVLEAVESGLPFGGSSLRMATRAGGDRCLYTWALGAEARPRPCNWLLLRAQPEWALDEPPRELTRRGVSTLAELAPPVCIAVDGAVAARQVADLLGDEVPVDAHPRFLPHLAVHRPRASVLIWPHDAVGAPGLERHELRTIVLAGAPERVRAAWRAAIQTRDAPTEWVEATVPGRATRSRLAAFWEACGEPQVLLRGQPDWAREGEAWLRTLGAKVARERAGTQLGLF
jgi:hypothetical protein